MFIILATLLSRELCFILISPHYFNFSNTFKRVFNLSSLLNQNLLHEIIFLAFLIGDTFQEFTSTSDILGRRVLFCKISRFLDWSLNAVILVFKVINACFDRFLLLTLFLQFLPHIFQGRSGTYWNQVWSLIINVVAGDAKVWDRIFLISVWNSRANLVANVRIHCTSMWKL